MTVDRRVFAATASGVVTVRWTRLPLNLTHTIGGTR